MKPRILPALAFVLAFIAPVTGAAEPRHGLS